MENPYHDHVAREERYSTIHALIAGLVIEVGKAADDKDQLLSKGRQYFAVMRATERYARELCTLAYHLFPESSFAEREELRTEIRHFNQVNRMVAECEKALKENESLDAVRQAFFTLFQKADSLGWGKTGKPLILPSS